MGWFSKKCKKYFSNYFAIFKALQHYSYVKKVFLKTAGVQGFLASRGYEPGPVDGAYGDKTANALRNYQASKGINQSGAIDDETIGTIKGDAAGDGPCESVWGPIKISGGATISVINSGNGCYFFRPSIGFETSCEL